MADRLVGSEVRFSPNSLNQGPKLSAWDRISAKLRFARVPDRTVWQTVLALAVEIQS